MSTPVTAAAAEAAVPAEASGKGKKKRKLTERQRGERKLAYMLCAPAVFAMVAVTAYPIAYALWLSLQRSDLRFPDQSEFVGLSNYITVLTAGAWWSAVGTTVIITVVSVIIELVLGMILALVMHRAIFGRGVVRASILVPYGIITVVAALAWQFMFTPATGFIPWLSDEALLTNTFGQYVAIIATEVWKTTPFMALLLLAGLAVVPDELHEAAKVDGATAMQRFFRITIPLMKPAILVALLFRTLDAFRVFDSVFILTGGNLRTVSILGYDTLITRLNLGLGSAVSVMIFVCVLIIALIFVKGFGVQANQNAGGK
ncbi:MAG: Maltodextrin ABC transporter, permease protein MdxF [uncultured Solirubrobacteraceae bacterium]|uniref:Maltodextrin ABC transporter, permease protein MdxF n=1 Tax=uncultured Solirubrobacteraceae bacterium TaxID=1162706 RepID=A0A6J4S1Y7_9ACTN|nr:MAG: Maltodextrin ABC transporter, permease protein MdxF [uncultured Solirubrobacteraceae bacterium]